MDPAEWLLDQLPILPAHRAEQAWAAGALAAIPLGGRFDSIRIHDRTALRLFRRLEGPHDRWDGVLYHRALHVIEFLVPGGTARHWHGGYPTTRAIGRDRGHTTACPRPSRIVRETFWLRPPGPHLTDPHRLVRALIDAGVRGLRYTPPRPHPRTVRPGPTTSAGTSLAARVGR